MALVEPYGYCRNCKHLFRSRKHAGERYYGCIYILHTKHSRPCPAGNGCIVRQNKKRGNRQDAMKALLAKQYEASAAQRNGGCGSVQT